MGQSSDQIRDEIDQKRADAADKIDQLQNQVQGTADEMRAQVQDTADQVKDTAQQVVEGAKASVDETVESLKNLDVRQQIEERPLVALGAALLGGFLLGGMSGGGANGYQSHSSGSSASSGFVGSQLKRALERSGLEETIASTGAALMGTVTDQLTSVLDRNFPGMADKMQSAQHEPGSFADKAKAAQASPT